MADKDNKFILGENTDGYRRSGTNDATRKFSVPEHKPRQRTQTKGQSQQHTQPQGQQRRQADSAKKSRKPAAGTQQRRPASTGKKPVRRPASGGQASMSQNERRRQHIEMRRRQRKRKQIFSYLVIAVVILGVAAALSLTVFFQISEITIKGESPYPDEQIIASSGISLGENVILCDADGVSGKLSASLPYIGSATVKRSLSGKVVINVKVTKGRYSFLYGEQCAIINEKGKVLEIAAAEKAIEHTMIQGVTATDCVPGNTVVFDNAASLPLIEQLGAGMDSVSISPLTSINISDTDYISTVYDGRLTLIIGSTDNLARKLALAAKVVERENELDPMQYGTVDLTIDGKAYFRPEEDTEDSPEENSSETKQPKNEPDGQAA